MTVKIVKSRRKSERRKKKGSGRKEWLAEKKVSGGKKKWAADKIKIKKERDLPLTKNERRNRCPFKSTVDLNVPQVVASSLS